MRLIDYQWLVIILDTNQLRSQISLTSPTIVMLRAIAQQSGQRLGIPQMVADEFIAQYRHFVGTLIANIQRDIGRLREADSANKAALQGASTRELIAMQHRELLEIIFEILPAPNDAAGAALQRELERSLPASTNWEKKGAGARDVVLWLTALSQMRDGEIVYLISGDEGAFGASGTLHRFLAAEVAERPGQLRYLNRIDDLLAVFGNREEASSAEFAWIAENPEVRAALSAVRIPPPAINTSIGWAYSYSLEPHPQEYLGASIEEVMLYRIGDDRWLSARAFWAGSHTQYSVQSWGTYPKPAGAVDMSGVVSHFRTPTTLLVQLGSEGEVRAAQVVSIGADELLRTEVINADEVNVDWPEP